ncbi:MAG: RpiB/LacA/LacB family sugar-phosphate isomerase [Rickettsiales bacterium]|jgi:ribose 5-phosphate isomerase RpiB|nr:RpiB/LacA/LacB family sugar-phosphate isomerase [Rickettsiales bacterium]
MNKENVYFIPSMDSVKYSKIVLEFLGGNPEIMEKFQLIHIESVSKLIKYDVNNLTGAQTADAAATLLKDFKHRAFLFSNSGNGALIRANMYPVIRAGTAISPEHAADSRLRAVCNTLVFPTKYMAVEDINKIALAFLLTEIDEKRKCELGDKQDNRYRLSAKIGKTAVEELQQRQAEIEFCADCDCSFNTDCPRLSNSYLRGCCQKVIKQFNR